MQVSGTFPALSDRMKKGKMKKKACAEPMEPREPGVSGYAMKRRPRVLKKNPTTLAGRRQASRDKTGS